LTYKLQTLAVILNIGPMGKLLKTLLCFFIFSNFCILAAGETSYKIIDNTHEDEWLPVTYVINGTFDVTQNHNWFSQRHFRTKSSELIKRIRNPHKSVKKDGGYEKLFKDEFLTGRVAPNIFLHTLGGAYDVAWLDEYYRKHEYPYPFLFSVVTSYFARLGNEVLETSYHEITSHDHIADLFFFDVLGVWLGSNPDAVDFMVDDLGMKAWHFQPVWDLEAEDFYNAGLNYIVRPKALEMKGCIRPLIFLGMQNLFGASLTCTGRRTISAATGFFFTDPLAQKGKLVTGLFYERDEDLAASLFINGSDNLRYRLNLHPGTLDEFINPKWKLGVFMGQTYQNDFSIGFNITAPVGLGHTWL
jgi:hypothetical protein